MFFEQVQTRGDRNFSYIIADEASGEAAIIDPGDNPDTELSILEQNEFILEYIINTHDHYDHTGGNAELSALTGANIVMHKSADSARDMDVSDGDTLFLGTLELKIIHTPGHTPDSICILAENELVSGDTLFVGKVGGTGFGKDASDEFDSLHNKIMTLPSSTRVWPGHDYGVRPSSTIGDELKENPFLLRDSLESFVDLKKNWLAYKKEHNIP